MASSEHLKLTAFIKEVHQNLRNESKILGVDVAWNKHCTRKDVLEKYAETMQELATKFWEHNFETKAISSRVKWIYEFCKLYFFQDVIVYQQKREQEIAKKINIDIEIKLAYNQNSLKLLDVGSCYNPFKKFKCFDVLAIDIAPATEDVYYCDFLNLSVIDRELLNVEKSKQISEMSRCTFDVIVFSLLLEYLPCPEQRLQCCIKAYQLLKFEGLLIIITPDSKHIGANAKLMKSWRYNLAKLGFSRIKYEKLSHIHCMAFRKSLNLKIAARWAELQNRQTFFNRLYIPQDFNCIKTKSDYPEVPNIDITEESKILLLNELPNFYT